MFGEFVKKRCFSYIYDAMKITTISIKFINNTKYECIGYVLIPTEVGGKYTNKKVYNICFKQIFLLTRWLVDHGSISLGLSYLYLIVWLNLCSK